jgi:hypothetical protein
VAKANIPTEEAQALFTFLSRLETRFDFQSNFTKDEIHAIVNTTIPKGNVKY